MKIAHVCPLYHPYVGGVPIHVREISERLAKKGFEIDVLSCDPFKKLPKEEVINNVKVKRFKSWAPNEAYFFSNELKTYLKKNSDNYDIIHAHNYGAFPALYAAQTKSKNKLVFTPHYVGGGGTAFRNMLHYPYRWISADLFLKADRVICVSKYEMDLLRNRFDVAQQKLQHIPNGVCLSQFNTLTKIKKNYKLILCISRLEKYKGIQNAIIALKKLNGNFCLNIVGRGPYEDNLVNLVKKLGLDRKVTFFHDLKKEEIIQMYAEADVFVLASKREAMPITIVEALSAKTPCILTKISPLLEWIDEKNCFGIDFPVDVDDLVMLINKVANIKIEGVDIFDWDKVTANLVNVYYSIS